MVTSLDKDAIFQSTASGKRNLKTFKEYTSFLVNSKTLVQPSLVMRIKGITCSLIKVNL